MTPKISVIIPLYNGGSWIKRAINSVISQTVQDFELIVIDDGSTDNSTSEVKKFTDERISLYSIDHKGVSFARNLGVKKAQSDLIAFLDADDEWTSVHIETLLNLRGKYQQAGIYLVNHIFKNDDNEIKNINSIIEDDILIPNFFTFNLKNDFIITSSVALPKKIFNEMKGFNENVVWGEDIDLWCRIALYYLVAYSHSVCTIVYKTGSWQEKYNKRLSITQEHPFIKSGSDSLNSSNLSESIKNDVIKLISRLKIISATNNIACSNFENAYKILKDMNNDFFHWRKVYLIFWVYLSRIIGTKSSQILFYYHLPIMARISKFLDQK